MTAMYSRRKKIPVSDPFHFISRSIPVFLPVSAIPIYSVLFYPFSRAKMMKPMKPEPHGSTLCMYWKRFLDRFTCTLEWFIFPRSRPECNTCISHNAERER